MQEVTVEAPVAVAVEATREVVEAAIAMAVATRTDVAVVVGTREVAVAAVIAMVCSLLYSWAYYSLQECSGAHQSLCCVLKKTMRNVASAGSDVRAACFTPLMRDACLQVRPGMQVVL